MTALPRRSSLLAALALTAALAAFAMTIGAPPAESASYVSCSMSSTLKYNPDRTKPTYNLTLKKKSTTCSTAKKVMKAYHSCRAKNSINCNHKVRTNWSCSATRTSNSSTRFNARFICSYGSRRVKSTYQQYK